MINTILLKQVVSKEIISYLLCFDDFFTAYTFGEVPLFLFSLTQHGTPPVEATDQANNQPHIVVFTDDDVVDDPMNQYFIAVEQTLLMQCSNAISAIFFLLAAHYIFNMAYHPKTNDILTFLQHKVAKLPLQVDHKWGTVAGTHIAGLDCQYKSFITEEMDI